MSKGSSAFWAFLSGVAVGTVLGVLYAPDKGKNTRDRLSFQLDKYREKLKSLLSDISEGKIDITTEAKEEGQKIVRDTKVKAEQLLGDVEDLMSQIKRK
jgi:gas vesicle protein